MSGQRITHIFRAKTGPLPGHRMNAAALTTDAYAERIAQALRRKWGSSRHSAKTIAKTVGAGVGTARKWLAGENGPSGEHLLRLAAECDEVWTVVLELTGRPEDPDAEHRQRMNRAMAILQGRE